MSAHVVQPHQAASQRPQRDSYPRCKPRQCLRRPQKPIPQYHIVRALGQDVARQPVDAGIAFEAPGDGCGGVGLDRFSRCELDSRCNNTCTGGDRRDLDVFCIPTAAVLKCGEECSRDERGVCAGVREGIFSEAVDCPWNAADADRKRTACSISPVNTMG